MLTQNNIFIYLLYNRLFIIMGNCDFKKKEEATHSLNISKVNFQMHYVIGRGGYGKVLKKLNIGLES